MNKKKRRFRFKPYSSFNVFLMIFGLLVSTTITVSIILSLFNKNIFKDDSPFLYIILGLLASQIIATAINSYFNKRVTKSIDIFLEALEELSTGNFSIRINDNIDPLFEEIKKQFNITAQELSSIETLKSDFASNFSHEFKTPIVSIKGFAKLLKDPNISLNEKEDYINTIIEEAERLANLSNNTLLLSKIESQVIVSEKSYFSLDEQIRKSVLLLETKWSTKNIQIDLDLDEISFYGAEILLKEVWINLIDNAIKFSPNDSTIKIRSEINDGSIQIIITDNGIGMDETTKKHLFDKYYQADSSRSTSGNGLGLAIVKKILSLNNANIDVISSPNKGSSFIVELIEEKKNIL